MGEHFEGRFAGKVAIVTGASHDPSIGRSTALRLAREGASVVINARSEEPLRAKLLDPAFSRAAVGVTRNATGEIRFVLLLIQPFE